MKQIISTALFIFFSTSAWAGGWTSGDPLMPTGDSTQDTVNLQAALHDSRLDDGGTLYLGPGVFAIHRVIGRQDLDPATPSYSTVLFNGTIQGAGKGVTILKGVRGPNGESFEPIQYLMWGGDNSDHTLLAIVQTYLGVKDLTFDSESELVDPFNSYGIKKGLVNYLGTGSFEFGLNPLIGTDITNVHFKGSLDSSGSPETAHLFQQWGDEGGVHNVTNSEFENSSNGALQFFDLLNASINVGDVSFVNHLSGALYALACDKSTVEISHSEIRNSWFGIYLYDSKNSLIEGNEISGEGWSPIILERSKNTRISNNFFTGDWVYGINPWIGSNNCTITDNVLTEMTSLYGAISVELSDRCTVSGNSFMDVSSPYGAVWVSGKGNTVQDNDYTQSGLLGWAYDFGAILLDPQSNGNHISETLFPPQSTICDQVLDLSGSGKNNQGNNSITGFGVCNNAPAIVESFQQEVEQARPQKSIP